jgi:WD40 repeat protein
LLSRGEKACIYASDFSNVCLMFLSLPIVINLLLYITLITVTSAKFIMHKQWILAGCSSGLVYVYRYEPEKKKSVEKIRVLQGHSNAINSLAVHSTKPCVLSASKGGKILIWDYENEWELMKTFDVKSPVQHVAFSPKDSNMFASAQDKTVKVCLVFAYMLSAKT